MKKRDIGILIGLGVVVLLVAWYFLVIGPKRDQISETDQQLQIEKNTYELNASRISRLDEERAAARQTTAEILKLNKLIPYDAQVPSLIIELQQSASEAGIKFMSIEPSEALPGTNGTTIVPFEVKFQGSFFDVNDFLYRVENYARMEGNDVNVSGRLLSVVTLLLDEPDLEPKFDHTPPNVLATLGINAYMTGAAPASSTAKKTSSSSDSSASSTGTQ
jgi:Tfp pilus assembly protein PilO